MTSFPVPVDNAHAPSSLRLLYPISQEVYCCGEDGQRQIVVLVTLPESQSRCVDEQTMTASQQVVDLSPSHVAEDLTTRPTGCTNSELHTNERLSRERTFRDYDLPEKLSVITPQLSARNPVFGKSKSPKSYWLRRHSDSVFAGADHDFSRRHDEHALSVEKAKERTVSDSQSYTVKEFDVSGSALVGNRKPLAHLFQSTVVGMQYSGESDEVFVEAPLVQSTFSCSDVDTGLQNSAEPTAPYPPPSLCNHRSRLTVVSTGDLEDVDEGNHSSGLSEHKDDSGDGEDVVVLSKSEVNEINEQPLSDSVRSMELSSNSLWQYSKEGNDDARYDDENRKLMNGERELTKPEAVNMRAAVHRRASRVVRSSRPSLSAESTSGCDETSGSGKTHRCAVCRRTFSRSDMLERHARLHTGVRPYACRLCTQVFSRSDHLTTHLRTHTGEKPYACPRCAYTASRRDMVTRHLRVHQSTSAVDHTAPVSGVVGPPRRRIYRSRYKDLPTVRPNVHESDAAAFCFSQPDPQPTLLDEGPKYRLSEIDGRRLGGAAPSWPGAQRSDTMSIPSPSPPASDAAPRHRLEHLHALHALSRSIVNRGSTGSTDSYSSPGCLSANDVFEFAVSGGGVEGSPDVFRSPSAARQSTMFIFPYTAASAALSVCDPTDSF